MAKPFSSREQSITLLAKEKYIGKVVDAASQELCLAEQRH
jgi:hypothetical protein